jgi:hypothetical protein
VPNDPRSGPPEFAIARLSGTWFDRPRSGGARLRLGESALEVLPVAGEPIVTAYASLSGAGFRTGCLTMHGAGGQLLLEAVTGLDRAWVALVERACPVPEFTRGLRALGSRRGGDASAQARFFAPLLQARRRLEEAADVDRRVDAFAAEALSERMRQVIGGLAAEWYPQEGPDRRALEAELSDALTAVFARLTALGAAASRVRAASDATRFDQWRLWLDEVAALFADADRGWSVAAGILPPRAVAPRRGRGRGTAAPAVALVASLLSSLGAPALEAAR